VQIVSGHADAMFLMQRLIFYAIVVSSICRHFRHFCRYRWLSKAPDCKVLMKRWSLWLMYKALETSYFMDVSLFSISLFTMLEQLGIGGSSRVVAVIG
jgi:hypothetical protein